MLYKRAGDGSALAECSYCGKDVGITMGKRVGKCEPLRWTYVRYSKVPYS